MCALFHRDDALVLGMMLYKYFQPPIKTGSTFNYSNGMKWGYVSGGVPATGSGGGDKGDNGKPQPSDGTNSNANTASLCGYGADQQNPGKGYQNGEFGKGGNTTTPVLYTLSCGGGGGWFGGGSSYLDAGGGGGSGYVNTSDSYKPVGYTPPSQFEAYMEIVKENGVNEGHGKVLINNIEFNYTGKVQKYITPADGLYKIECLGAQGGVYDVRDKYNGGKGGYVASTFLLQAGTELFIYVGEAGGEQTLGAWNGGGRGLGGAYGGGGASDVRWAGQEDSSDWTTTLINRFIVAGGGGGVSKNSNVAPDLNPPLSTDLSPNGQTNETELKTQPSLYLVNDLTICNVDLTYLCSQTIDYSDIIGVRLFLDDVDVGFIPQQPLAGGGSTTFVFPFSDILPANTPTYWAKIVAQVETTTPIIIPPNGLIIRLTTNLRDNESVPTNKPPLYLTSTFFSVETVKILDIFNIVVETPSGPVVDNPDHIVDIVTIEDLNSFEIKTILDSNSSETLTIEDIQNYVKLTVFKVDVPTSNVTVQDVILIEGGGSLPPNLDALYEELSIVDAVTYDLRNVSNTTSTSSTTLEDVITYTLLTTQSLSYVENLELQDVIMISGIPEPPPNLDSLYDVVTIQDTTSTKIKTITKNSNSDSMQLSDIVQTVTKTVIKQSNQESLEMQDVCFIEIH